MIARTVEAIASGLNGNAWVRKNLGHASFKKWDRNVCMVPFYRTVFLASWAQVGTIVHELGHVLENKIDFMAVWGGGGAGDRLLKGNDVTDLVWPRWLNERTYESLGTSFHDQLQENSMLLVQPDYSSLRQYGNRGPADYFADSFSFFVTGDGTIPPQVQTFFEILIVDLAK